MYLKRILKWMRKLFFYIYPIFLICIAYLHDNGTYIWLLPVFYPLLRLSSTFRHPFTQIRQWLTDFHYILSVFAATFVLQILFPY